MGNNKEGNTKFFTGNEGIDGGLIGFGLGSAAGAIGAPLLGGAASALLGGGNQGYNGGGCGRKKRSADGEERFFLPTGGSCTCGRKKRQAPHEGDKGNTRFFNLGGLLGGGTRISSIVEVVATTADTIRG